MVARLTLTGEMFLFSIIILHENEPDNVHYVMSLAVPNVVPMLDQYYFLVVILPCSGVSLECHSVK